MDRERPAGREQRIGFNQDAHRRQVQDEDVMPRRDPASDRPGQLARKPALRGAPLALPRHGDTHWRVAGRNSKMRILPVGPNTRTAYWRRPAPARYSVPDDPLPDGPNATIDDDPI